MSIDPGIERLGTRHICVFSRPRKLGKAIVRTRAARDHHRMTHAGSIDVEITLRPVIVFNGIRSIMAELVIFVKEAKKLTIIQHLVRIEHSLVLASLKIWIFLFSHSQCRNTGFLRWISIHPFPRVYQSHAFQLARVPGILNVERETGNVVEVVKGNVKSRNRGRGR